MIIETQGLRKQFGPTVAVSDLSLRVSAGEIFGFLGPNGAGKTTSIKMLLALVEPTSGTGQVLGAPLGDRASRARIGFLPEHFRFHETLTATAEHQHTSVSISAEQRNHTIGVRPVRRSGTLWTTMSATVHATGLAAGHGARSLFHGLDLVVAPGDVIGLVGANGAGKSTLLRILARARAARARPRHRHPARRHRRLPPAGGRAPARRDRARLPRAAGPASPRAHQALEDASKALAEDQPGAADVYAAALERWLALGGADLDARAEALAADLGLGVDLDATMTTLSGGQAARAGLASLLLSRFDLVLLDEPTNDLDLDGLARLEDFVAGLRGGAVIVSHDREFLARTVNEVVELDAAQQQVGVYLGGYDAYLAERAVARRHAREAYEEYADTKAGLEARARMQRGWADKGVRNARRKAAAEPDKNVKHHAAQTSEKQAAKARQTDRMLARLEVVEEPRKEWDLRMAIAAAPRSGTVVATLHQRGRAAGRVHARSGRCPHRLGATAWSITGANGSGKSTLLGALLGRIPLDEGTATLGSRVQIGEIDQARALFLGEEALVEAFRDADRPATRARDTHAAREVRARRGARRPSGGQPLARRAHPRRARAAAGPPGQPAGARRADQPPGPARDRAAGGRAGPLRRARSCW